MLFSPSLSGSARQRQPSQLPLEHVQRHPAEIRNELGIRRRSLDEEWNAFVLELACGAGDLTGGARDLAGGATSGKRPQQATESADRTDRRTEPASAASLAAATQRTWHRQIRERRHHAEMKIVSCIDRSCAGDMTE